MKTSDLVGLAGGFLVGDAASSLVSDSKPVEKILVGLVGGSIGASVIQTISKETGVSDLIDDVFDLF